MAEISGEMGERKVAHLMEVRPEYLIGADVSCLLNISGRLQPGRAESQSDAYC